MTMTAKFAALLCGAVFPLLCTAQPPELEAVDPLPEVLIAGNPVKIHTQGLYVTERAYLVTGRVDTPPRRPVMMLFQRQDPTQYQVLELSLAGKPAQNHPGGFDRDAKGVFWIPVSTSTPVGPTTVVGIKLDHGGLPDRVSDAVAAFELSDHIGAICCLGDGQLLGANWDTKTVYLIDADRGEILRRWPREEFFGDAAGVRLAVQDWKYDHRAKLVVAGGIDKSPRRQPRSSSAVIAKIDVVNQQIIATQRVPSRADVSRPLTNEGLAIWAEKLFLLPEDFGSGAKVLRYSIQPH